MTSSPIFGVTLTIITYYIGIRLNEKWNTPITNPMIVGVIGVVLVLGVLGIPYSDYNEGGRFFTFLLSPVTVCLIVPFYHNYETFITYRVPIIAGSFVGAVVGIFSIYFFGKFFQWPDLVLISVLPKSVTSAIAMPVSVAAGGDAALTAASTAITGMGGFVLSDLILKSTKVKEDVAKGAALGTATHASGVTKALSISEKAGAIASLCLVLTALITAILYQFVILLV